MQIVKNQISDKIKENKNVLIIFKAEWCGECKMLEFQLTKLKDKLDSNKISVFTLDTDKEELWDEDGKNDWMIKSVPTTIGFIGGKEIFREEKYLTQNELEEIVKKFH